MIWHFLKNMLYCVCKKMKTLCSANGGTQILQRGNTMKSNLIEKGKKQLVNKAAMYAVVKQTVYWLFTLVFLELMLHISAFGIPKL